MPVASCLTLASGKIVTIRRRGDRSDESDDCARSEADDRALCDAPERVVTLASGKAVTIRKRGDCSDESDGCVVSRVPKDSDVTQERRSTWKPSTERSEADARSSGDAPERVVTLASGKAVTIRKRGGCSDESDGCAVPLVSKDSDVTQERRSTWKPSSSTLRHDDARSNFNDKAPCVADDLLPFTAESLWKGLLSKKLMSGKVATKRASDIKHDSKNVRDDDRDDDAANPLLERKDTEDKGRKDDPVAMTPSDTPPAQQEPPLATIPSQKGHPAPTPQTSNKAKATAFATAAGINVKRRAQTHHAPKQQRQRQQQLDRQRRQWEEHQRQQAAAWSYYEQMRLHQHWQMHAHQQWRNQPLSADAMASALAMHAAQAEAARSKGAKRARSTTAVGSAWSTPAGPLQAELLPSTQPSLPQAQVSQFPKDVPAKLPSGWTAVPKAIDAELKVSNTESPSSAAAGSNERSVCVEPEPTKRDQAATLVPPVAVVKEPVAAACAVPCESAASDQVEASTANVAQETKIVIVIAGWDELMSKMMAEFATPQDLQLCLQRPESKLTDANDVSYDTMDQLTHGPSVAFPLKFTFFRSQANDEDDEEDEDIWKVVEQRKRELMAKLPIGEGSQAQLSHSGSTSAPEGQTRSAQKRSLPQPVRRLDAPAIRGHGGA